METQKALNVKVIVGSTRPGRFSEKPAAWIAAEAAKREGWNVEILDLRDYPMPFFEEPMSLGMGAIPKDETVLKWEAKIAEADAYIIIAPEYNHGYTAVLKNALDYAYQQWNNKAVGFVGYGSVGGARSVEQLRQVAVELQMAPIRNSIHIPWATYMDVVNAKDDFLPAFASLEKGKEGFLTQLEWWATALKTAREKTA